MDVNPAALFGGSVSVGCINAGDVSATVSGTSVIGNTVTVSFNPALPDEDTCTVNLDCGALVCLSGLRGDTNRDGTTSTADASIIKPKFGGDPAVDGAEFDYNVDGIISTADFSQVKPLFGNTAPICP